MIWDTLYQDARFIKDYLLYKINGILRRKRDIYNLKDIHKGERCFIIATGPSLTMEDINRLKSEYTFSVNSCFRIFDKTDWRPTYYVITDKKFINDIGKDLDNISFCNPFCGMEIPWITNNLRIFNTTKLYQNFPQRGLLRWVLLKNKFNFFSKDASKGIISGHTVVHSVLQLAEYMGFSKIYLLGTDCNYKGELQYSKLMNHNNVNNPNAADNMFLDYMYAKRHFDNTMCTVYNATRGGMLEIFERVNFDNLFD